MQVHYSMNNLPEIPSPVVTVGSFDGVHLGHRVIIGRLNNLARQVDGSSVLITFYPHPRMVLYPESSGKGLKLINSQEEKIRLLEDIGLDHLIIMEFTRDFARTSSDDFVEQYLVGKLRAHTIVVGFNHCFGYNREGNFDSLYAARERFAFRVEEIPEQEIQNETVSSTRIRKALLEGNIQRANAYLEHFYMIRAKLESPRGGAAGEERSFIEITVSDPYKLLPPEASYAASFFSGARNEKALVHIAKNGLRLYSLEPDTLPVAGDLEIYFHLRLSGPGDTDIPGLLDAIRELIY